MFSFVYYFSAAEFSHSVLKYVSHLITVEIETDFCFGLFWVLRTNGIWFRCHF